jgi:hypothetical protein
MKYSSRKFNVYSMQQGRFSFPEAFQTPKAFIFVPSARETGHLIFQLVPPPPIDCEHVMAAHLVPEINNEVIPT